LTIVPTVPAPRRGRPPKHSRPVLLNAASAVLVQRGYGGLRYRDVAEAANVPVASLQHYFPNLAELRREALLHQVHTEISTLASQVASISDPWDRLRHIVAATVELEPASRKAEWMLWLEFWRAAAHEPEIATESLTEERALRELVEAAIRDGMEAGIFRPLTSPEKVARTVLAMVDGFGLHLAINDGEGDAEMSVELIESFARHMLQVDSSLPSFQPVLSPEG
jgi:AcrR family transcriptional regulator